MWGQNRELQLFDAQDQKMVHFNTGNSVPSSWGKAGGNQRNYGLSQSNKLNSQGDKWIGSTLKGGN